jgi:hypothetical protein
VKVLLSQLYVWLHGNGFVFSPRGPRNVRYRLVIGLILEQSSSEGA